jgi:acyl carrier protein
MQVTFEELRETLDEVFGPDSKMNVDSSYMDVEAWDSLTHVSLIMALQERYGLAIEVDKAIELNSIKKILVFLNSVNHQ